MKFGLFLLYSLAWDVFCFGGTTWLILYHGWSRWWYLAALALSLNQIRFKESE